MMLVLLLVPGIDADTIPGVKGDLIRIDKNKGNVGQIDKITAHVGDRIEVDWTYAVIPEEIPIMTSAKSDAASVKFDEIRQIVRPKLVGAGMLGALFTAEKEGKAALTFAIKSKGSKDAGAILKCEVEVLK
jgi:hypothetical protein